MLDSCNLCKFSFSVFFFSSGHLGASRALYVVSSYLSMKFEELYSSLGVYVTSCVYQTISRDLILKWAKMVLVTSE